MCKGDEGEVGKVHKKKKQEAKGTVWMLGQAQGKMGKRGGGHNLGVKYITHHICLRLLSVACFLPSR